MRDIHRLIHVSPIRDSGVSIIAPSVCADRVGNARADTAAARSRDCGAVRFTGRRGLAQMTRTRLHIEMTRESIDGCHA